MTVRRVRPRLGAAAVTAGIGAATIVAASAPADIGHAAAKRVTPSGVGAVKLGRTFHALHARGLVGRRRQGCELAGPGKRSARLRSPLKGTVDFTRRHRVKNVVITGGATARGVGIGSRSRAIRVAFPKARFNHRTDRMFGVTLVRVPRRGGSRIAFAVSTKTHRVQLIGVPAIPFCE